MDKSDLTGESAAALRERIKQSLALSGMRQADLARACEISPAAVSLWFARDEKKATIPTEGNLRVIARETGLAYTWLVYGEGEPPAGLDRLKAGGRARLRAVPIEEGAAGDFTRAPRPKTRDFTARFRGALLALNAALAGNVDQEVATMPGREILAEELRQATNAEVDWPTFEAAGRHRYDYISSRLAVQVAALMPAASVSGRMAANHAMLQFNSLRAVDAKARVMRDFLLVLVPQESDDAEALTLRERTALAVLSRDATLWGIQTAVLSRPEALAEIVNRVERGIPLARALAPRGGPPAV